MHRYLKAHPEIFMPDVKELHFFGKDIRARVPFAAQSEEEYLKLFASSESYKRRGEASIYYVYSQFAAQEMYAFNPEAKIIILIREPLELIYSLHFQHVFNQWCSDPDFATDLQLQEQEQGTDQEKIHYRSLIQRLPKNIATFQQLFGKDNVKIILAEEFLNNTSDVFRDTLKFLGVAPSFKPEQFKQYNRNKTPRLKQASNIFGQGSQTTAAMRQFIWKNPWLYQFLYKLRYFLFFELNAKEEKRPPMESQLKDQLQSEFTPIIKELEKICDKDLSGWYHSSV